MEQMFTAEAGGSLAGFGLVRRIGVGSRSEVYLGRAAGVDGGTVTAAVKVYSVDADGRAADRQVRALLAVPPGPLNHLIDVATAPDGRPVLVLERLAGPTLERLLTERGRIAPGEVITIVATVTSALQALHNAGFSHPVVTPGCVRFDATGRPVLLGLGALQDLPPGAAGVARRRDDLVRLAGFARCVVDHLDHRLPASAGADAVLLAFEAAATRRPLPVDLLGVEEVLFAWAAATSVTGAVPGGPDTISVSADGASLGGARPGAARAGAAAARREHAADAAVGAHKRAGRPEGEPAAPSALRRLLDRRRRPMAALVPGLVERLRSGVARVRVVGRPTGAPAAGGVGRRRRSAQVPRPAGRWRTPLAVGIGVCVLLVSGALAVLPGVAEQGGVGRDADASRAAEPPGPPGPTRPPDGAPAGRSGASTLQGDDPAQAVLELLRARAACLAEASVLCLEAVHQPGSVAMAADSYLVRDLQASGGTIAPLPAGTALTATLQERTGNAALVLLSPAGEEGIRTQPASALVIKGEAGWRLRELFDY
jgi:hypothetical protein